MKDLFKDCTIDCERMPECGVCGKTKKPIGRDAPVETYYCDEECLGYRKNPTPGHLWPGELADIRAVEK